MKQLSEATGGAVGDSQIGKVERGERVLSHRVALALADAMDLSYEERAEVGHAMAGRTRPDEIDRLRADLTEQMTLLRGELRGGMAAILAALERRPRP